MTDPLKHPSKPEIKKRSRLFEVSLLSLLVGFAVLAFFAKQYPYFPFDLYITRNIQLINSQPFNYLMLVMTEIGFVIPGALLVAAGCLTLIRFRKLVDAGILLLSTSGAVLLSLILKLLVARPRPDPNLIEQVASYQVKDSFPSGHVLFFTGFAGFLLYLSWIYLPKGILRYVVIGLWTLLIILMGISRIFLGAHWFSDTLGAYLIGGVWLFVVIFIRRRYIDFPKA